MRSSSPRHTRTLARGVALLGLACALPAHADWKRDYDRGLRAFEKQNWAEAEAAFRAALAEEPAPDARKRFQGVRTAVYVPHYYAGVAAWRQGACDRALQLWSNTASTAVVAGVSTLDAEQERGTLDCRARIAAAKPAATTTTASTAATAPGASKPDASTASQPSPGSGAVRLPAAPQTASRTAASKPVITPPATNTRDTAVPQAPATRPSSAPATAPPPAAAAVAPAAFTQALDHYLAGRYDALLQLEPRAFADGRSRAQAYLLRAAARQRLAELDGSGDTAVERVRSDIRAARAANAALTPDPAWFPPRFVTFWNASR